MAPKGPKHQIKNWSLQILFICLALDKRQQQCWSVDCGSVEMSWSAGFVLVPIQNLGLQNVHSAIGCRYHSIKDTGAQAIPANKWGVIEKVQHECQQYGPAYQKHIQYTSDDGFTAGLIWFSGIWLYFHRKDILSIKVLKKVFFGCPCFLAPMDKFCLWLWNLLNWKCSDIEMDFSWEIACHNINLCLGNVHRICNRKIPNGLNLFIWN